MSAGRRQFRYIVFENDVHVSEVTGKQIGWIGEIIRSKRKSMKSRKLTVIIVSLCMCVSVLSGCGSTAEKEQVQYAAETQTAEAEPDTSLEDGEYTVNVELEGGSGRASVDSEAKVKVTDGQAYATIVWSSTYYDYMLVDGKKYTNENEGGNSTFTFPIAGVPCTMDVVGDTTAMSQPHEIDYTLTFSFAKDVSFKELKQTGQVKLSYADQFQIDEYGNYTNCIQKGTSFTIKSKVKFLSDIQDPIFTYTFKTGCNRFTAAVKPCVPCIVCGDGSDLPDWGAVTRCIHRIEGRRLVCAAGEGCHGRRFFGLCRKIQCPGLRTAVTGRLYICNRKYDDYTQSGSERKTRRTWHQGDGRAFQL